jgi:hypothetical protein
MRIENLIENTNHRQLLRESCDGLTLEQRRIVEGIYNEFVPLIEASLTADQITQIFSNVEKSATAAGGNRTMLGKAVDVPGQVNDVINKVGKYLQDTTPVKFMDQKFEDLKAKVGAKFPKLDTQLTGLGTWMKENPGKSAAIIGLLTVLASLAGGPVGGAIAGQALRGAAELIKGEKLSTAIGKGVKTAVFGFLSGKAFEMLGDFAETLAIKQIPFGPESAGFQEVTFDATKTISSFGQELKQTLAGVDIIVDPEMASTVNSAMNLIRMGGKEALDGFDQLKTAADIINSQEYKDMIVGTLEITRQELVKNDSLRQFISATADSLQAVSQGAVAASTGSSGKEKKESYYVQTRPLSEGQVYLVFDRVVKLNEGPIWDKVKGAAGKAVGAVAQKAGQIGTNLTTKVTADKLNSAWKKAGSPMDSEEVAKILTAAGVGDDIVKQVYTDLKISAAPSEPEAQAATGGYAEVKKAIAQLNTKDRKRMIAYLTKQLGTA